MALPARRAVPALQQVRHRVCQCMHQHLQGRSGAEAAVRTWGRTWLVGLMPLQAPQALLQPPPPTHTHLPPMLSHFSAHGHAQPLAQHGVEHQACGAQAHSGVLPVHSCIKARACHQVRCVGGRAPEWKGKRQLSAGGQLQWLHLGGQGGVAV